MSELFTINSEHREITAEAYHADPAISSGALEDFRQSRRLYEGRYITGTVPKQLPTPAMLLGTYVHMRILEPDRFYSLLAEPLPELAPDGKKWLRRKDSDHEKWWAEEQAKREGKLALEEWEIERIEAIAKSVLSKRWARSLLSGEGQSEFSIFWTDPETGLRLRCLVDWFRELVSIDLKTTGDSSPEQFVKRCVSLGYHRKRAHYLAGLQAFTGQKESHLIHIAVATEPPYSAGAYELIDIDRYTNRSLGHMEWRHTLRTLARCLESGDFSDAWETEILSIELPPYAFSQSLYQT